MTVVDAKSMSRFAQQLAIEVKVSVGSPPYYPYNWISLWNSKIEKIEINPNSTPSVAVFWFPQYRWPTNLVYHKHGNMVRIRTTEPNNNDRSIIFQGFITRRRPSFSGGTESTKAHERFSIVALDFRWLLAVTSPVFGQAARGPDDYYHYGASYQYPKNNSYTFLTGRRTIFNANGKPDKDPILLNYTAYSQQVPLFADPENAVPWTARDMIVYILSPLYNRSYNYIPIKPSSLPGLEYGDFDKVLSNISVEGLNVMEAVELVCRHIGWSFRQDFTNTGSPTLVFYKSGSAYGYSRRNEEGTILHQLHAPAVGENITTAVSQGRKLLWSMVLDEDISEIINEPQGFGSPHRFEFTTALVPAWLDSELVPDVSEELANLFFTQAQLQELTLPNEKNYYRYYHPRGNSFLRNVGRQWALNESGKYSGSATYNRGMPFDFSNVIDSKYILNYQGKRLFAPFRRQLLPCLTVDKDSFSSVGIRVEFSLDFGYTWQVLPASISSLGGECGIYIDEANLAEMVDQSEGIISGGDLDGVQLNYWTSLCDDIVNGRSFKNGQWRTRIRVTASIQMDMRLGFYAPNISNFSSPFRQSRLYDFSERYGLAKRSPQSVFFGSSLPAYQVDSSYVLSNHLEAIRRANQNLAVSGVFVLERLWLGDGSGRVHFTIGDGVEKITGRNYNLFISSDQGIVYPEIIKIIYMPEEQKMQLITRDLRFAEVSL